MRCFRRVSCVALRAYLATLLQPAFLSVCALSSDCDRAQIGALYRSCTWTSPARCFNLQLENFGCTFLFSAGRHLISLGGGRYGDTACRGGTQTGDGDPNKEPFYSFSEASVKQSDIRTLMTPRTSLWSSPYRIEGD